MGTIPSLTPAGTGFTAPWSPPDISDSTPRFLNHPEALRELGPRAQERNQRFVDEDRPEVGLVAALGCQSSASQRAATPEPMIAALRGRARALMDRGYKVTLVVVSGTRPRLWFAEGPFRILSIEDRFGGLTNQIPALACEFARIGGCEARARRAGARKNRGWTETYGADAAFFEQMRQQVQKLAWTAADLRRTFRPLFEFRTEYGLRDLPAAYGENAALLAERLGMQAAPVWAEAQKVWDAKRRSPWENAARWIGGKLGWDDNGVAAFVKDYDHFREYSSYDKVDANALGFALLLRRWNGGEPRLDDHSVDFNRHVWIPSQADVHPSDFEAEPWQHIRLSLVNRDSHIEEKYFGRELPTSSLHLSPAALIVARDQEVLAWAQGLGAWAGARFFIGDPLTKPQAFHEVVTRLMMGGVAAMSKTTK